MPEYIEKELSERYYLFAIVGTLHQLELKKFIEEDYVHISKNHKKMRDDHIENNSRNLRNSQISNYLYE